MTVEQLNKICAKIPFAKEVVTTLVVFVLFVALTIVTFLGHQMFDDKHTYDSGSTVVDFVNWFKDTTKDTVNSVIQDKLNEHQEQDTNVVDVDQDRSTNNVGSAQTDVLE